MESYKITPKVDETQEFIEIANDFSNPLDLVREAISNSYDAQATDISIAFNVIKQYGESILEITLNDNGAGMSSDELQNFFDLGNSTRREDSSAIGDKGYGTKVYFNSRKIEVRTSMGNSGLHAVMDDPFRKLHDREIPTVHVTSLTDFPRGTEIRILGYNNNRRDKVTHYILKDYISWFTKHGSIENQFSDSTRPVTLKLKGLGHDDYETIPKGHVFPEDSEGINSLFEKRLTKAPDYYSKKIIWNGVLRNFPEMKYQAVFCIEGKYQK